MPYQILDSEIIFAGAIWLIAIFVFVIMLIVVFATHLFENRTKNEYNPKDELQKMREYLSQSKVDIPTKEKELNSPAWEQD